LDGARYIDLCDESYCAIRQDRQLVCGDFDSSAGMTPEVIPELKDLAAIELEPGKWTELGSSSDSWKGTGCALTVTGEVLCFGQFACDEPGSAPSPPWRIIVDESSIGGAGESQVIHLKSRVK
jgi:hypothetical protein